MSFSCYESDASSCPTTPSSQASTPSARTERENKAAYYALHAENELLRDELVSITEKLEDLERKMAASAMMSQQEKQRQSPKEWIRGNLEEAQHLIDNIVGIKGITEDPLKAAIKMGISQPHPEQPQPQSEHSVRYHDYQAQMPRVSISSSIVPSNEELYGY